MGRHLLTCLIFLPLAAALIQGFIPARHMRMLRIALTGTTLVQLLLFAFLTVGGTSLEENMEWFSIGSGTDMLFSTRYHLGLDGLSLPLVGMSLVTLLAASLASWKITRQFKGYSLLFQLLNTAVLGTFCALDMFLFYVFFEFMLIPMYFLVGIWGGEKRTQAAIKFFLYTLTGSILILIAMIVIAAGAGSLDVDQIKAIAGEGTLLDPVQVTTLAGLPVRTWVFFLLLTGFAIKIPVVPLHTWLPEAHVEAPTAISVILAAILLKTGTYGLIRYTGMIFPSEWLQFSTFIGTMAVLSIVYGGLNALAAKDLKRLVAYSSVSHMGFVLLGMAAGTVTGMEGAVYQMVSHGFISAMLFLIAGVLQDRTGTRQIEFFSGLHERMPVYTTVVFVAFFAAMGIPGFSAFIGEVLVLLGSYSSENLPGWMAVTATLGIVLSAGYLLWTITRIIFGPFLVRSDDAMEDLKPLELVLFIPLAVLIIWLGLWPAPLLEWINPFAQEWAGLFPTAN